MNKKEQGKKNRASGARFELAVRKDLESKGWIISKWQNNVELHKENSIEVSGKFGGPFGKLIVAKRKFNPFKKVLGIGSGFPDFIAIKPSEFKIQKRKELGEMNKILFKVIGVEAKINGYLDKEEKLKCRWLLDNNIFSRILTARKGEKRGEIIYQEYDHKAR